MIPLRSLVPRSRPAVVTTLLILVNVLAFLFELSLGPTLPRFVREGGAATWPEIREGLELSGHFLIRDVLTGRTAGLAEARSRLVDRLLRAGGLI